MNENHQARQDPLEDAIRAFQRMSVPEPPPDSELLWQLDTGQSKLGSRFSIHTHSKRRYLMRLLVLSAAAALVLIGGITLFVLNSSPVLALADVVKAAEKHKLVKYKWSETTTDEQGRTAASDRTVFADLKVAQFRSEGRHKFVDPDDREKWIEEVSIEVQDLANDRWLMTITHPGGKVIAPRKEAWLNRFPGDLKKCKTFLNALQDFQQQKGVTSGEDTLGGRETIRFRCEDKKQIKDATLTTTIWVDAKIKLPVREEFKISYKTGMTTLIVQTDFEWDPKLPKGIKSLDELFSTKPPEGYQLEDKTQNDK